MTSAEKLQDVINELQGKVPAVHLHSIAARIASAEEKAESLERTINQIQRQHPAAVSAAKALEGAAASAQSAKECDKIVARASEKQKERQRAMALGAGYCSELDVTHLVHALLNTREKSRWQRFVDWLRLNVAQMSYKIKRER